MPAMKRKNWVIVILTLCILPASYCGYRIYRHMHAPVRKIHPAETILPFQPNITIHDQELRGYLLLTPFEKFKKKSHGKLVIMDMNGKIYFQKMVNQPAYDFRQWKINGKIYYTYIVNDPKAHHFRGVNLANGHAVILDSAMNELKQVHLKPFGDITVGNHQDLDLHEFILLGENHYIAIANYEKSVHNIPDSLHPSPYVKVGAPLIEEVENDSLVWHWDGSEYPEFFGASTENNKYADTSKVQDYLHINSLFLDPVDGNLICSFRGSNQVIKIRRRDGKVLWRLGGLKSDFPLTLEQTFLRQHSVTLTDNNKTLLMIDNGDTTLRKSSRILEFKLDEQHKKITSFKATAIPDTACLFMGLVTKEKDDYFLGAGTDMYVLQMNQKTGKKRFQMFMNQISYRAYKVDSIYGLEKGKPQ